MPNTRKTIKEVLKQTNKGKTTMKNIRDILIDLANEFQNDYLTIEKMAEHKSIDAVALEAMIKEGQKLRRNYDYQNN